MLAFVWLLWGLFRGSLGGPVAREVWSEEVESVNAAELGASRPSFYRLPVFLHAPGPLVPPELFRPVPHKTALPAGLGALLVPSTEQQETGRDTGARAVDVWCGMDTITVRVDRLQLRAWTDPTLFRLGSCAASRVTSRYLFFHYSLLGCGGDVRVAGGQLVYTFLMSYAPPPQDYVIRVFPLHLPIHCYYNRFHYSYQVGFKPQIQQTTLLKSLRSKLTFSLTVCDAQWDPLPPGHSFLLGEPVYFLAQAGVLLAGERLYVDRCYATGSEDSGSSPRVDVISNHGCMMDSRRDGSSSQFLSGGGAVLKFSIDAFLFEGVSQVQFLHCSLSVGLQATHTAKSCNYNRAAGRWEEMSASSSVCSCCDSLCGDDQTAFKNRVRSSGWSVGRTEEKPELEEVEFPAEEEKSRMDVDLKAREEKDAAADRKHWKTSVAAPAGTGEAAAGRLQPPLSDGNETAPTEDAVPGFKSYFVSDVAAPWSNHSSTGDVSTGTTPAGAAGGSGTGTGDLPPGDADPELRTPEKRQAGPGGSEAALWSERIRCGHEPVDGPSPSDDGGAESNQPAHSELRHLICVVDQPGSGSGSLHPSPSEGAKSGSEGSQEARSSRAAVVVTTSPRDSSGLGTGPGPEPGLRSLGFVAMQPSEVERELRRRLIFGSPDGTTSHTRSHETLNKASSW